MHLSIVGALTFSLLSANYSHASPAQVATFEEPLGVVGFTERAGPPGCRVRFEYQTSDGSWHRLRFGHSTIGPDEQHIAPPHDSRPRYSKTTPSPSPSPGGPRWICLTGSYDELTEPFRQAVALWRASPMEWRIVDENGTTLTTFFGPWAVDPWPFARLLGAQSDLEATLRSPACSSKEAQASCLTAFEIWHYHEEWAETHCADPLVEGRKSSSSATPQH